MIDIDTATDELSDLNTQLRNAIDQRRKYEAVEVIHKIEALLGVITEWLETGEG